MATRYCGNLRITLTYRDSGIYHCRVYSPDSKRVWSGTTIPPQAGFGPGVAYDSPAAYDETARAAVAFAVNDSPELPTEIETVATYRCACGAVYTPTAKGDAGQWSPLDSLACNACGAVEGLRYISHADRYYVRRIK